ncbi:PAS domain-containing protein [Halomonas sp. PA16-9]|uniref:PAS domain-containing protein n=1 Tax=Halomonas sp. PA16-9 TaxID=2576841 RepID=UPI0030ECFB9D
MSSVLPRGQLDQFFLLSRDLFCCIDFKGTLLQVNPAFETLLGYTSEQLIGRSCGVVINPLDHPVIERALQRVHQGEKVIPFEVRAVSATGKQHWLEISPSLGEDVIYVIARVITRRKASEQQLKLLERSVESSTNGVLIVDAQSSDLPLVYVNAAFERITGYSRNQALGVTAVSYRGKRPTPPPSSSYR